MVYPLTTRKKKQFSLKSMTKISNAKFGRMKKTSIFASHLKKEMHNPIIIDTNTLLIGMQIKEMQGVNYILLFYWRDGRVVDCGGLENR